MEKFFHRDRKIYQMTETREPKHIKRCFSFFSSGSSGVLLHLKVFCKFFSLYVAMGVNNRNKISSEAILR